MIGSRTQAWVGATATGVVVPARNRQSFRHEALIWRDATGFTDRIVRFIRDGHTVDDPVLVLMTAEHSEWVQDALGADSDQAAFVDVTDLGRNPARILPVIQDYMAVRGERPARAVVEAVWPGRRTEEIVECQLHEALLNMAVAPERPFWLICPYDEAGLEPAVIEAAHRSHPLIARPTSYQGSGCYGGYLLAAALATTALPELAHDSEVTVDVVNVSAAVRAVTLAGVRAGLRSDQILHNSEATRHLVAASAGRGGSTVVIGTAETSTALIIDVVDSTTVDDLLLGWRSADVGEPRWRVNTICDLVQTRFTPTGVVTRIHTWKETQHEQNRTICAV